MAELIDKQTVLDWVQKQIEAVTKKQVAGSDGIFTREVLTTMQRDLSTFENAINAMPTTTEADIRNKAIEEFAEKISDAYSEHSTTLRLHGVDFDILTVDGAIEIMWDLVSEQLKEGQ